MEMRDVSKGRVDQSLKEAMLKVGRKDGRIENCELLSQVMQVEKELDARIDELERKEIGGDVI